MAKIAPSLLAADCLNLEAEIKEVESAGAEWLHIDIMDGHFVSNLSYGLATIERIRKVTDMFLDVHVMAERPKNWAERMASAGADLITVHQEACLDLRDTVEEIKKYGVKAGIALKPTTPFKALNEAIDIADAVLFMTVEPGAGGQPFITATLEKIKTASAVRKQNIKSIGHLLFIADGGVNKENAPLCVSSGIDILVAGTSVFGAKDRKKAFEEMKRSCDI